MRIVEKIVLAADRKGLSQARVERLAGLTPGRISKWTGGKGEPSGAQCWRLAGVLDLPVAWLLDDEAGGEPPSTSEDDVVLRVYHALGIGLDDAIRRLSTPAPAVPPPVEPRLLGSVDLTEHTRRRIADRRANRGNHESGEQ